MISPMIWFAIASLSPLAFLAASCLWSAAAPWLPWLALMNQTLLVWAMDHLGGRLPPAKTTFGADLLSVLLALGHLGLILPVIGTALNIATTPAIALLLSLGLFIGQVSHPNAHELIHHPRRAMRRLGALIYSSMLLGHHVSAHLRVHHSQVATLSDPNSAPRGMGFYRFLPRAWLGSFQAGLRAENTARERMNSPTSVLRHPYLGYGLIAALMLMASALLADLPGVVAYLGVAFYAQTQVFLADYVQHYGLQRSIDSQGKPAPVGPQHSWNAPHWYSSAMMLNAPRHSDHHLHPKRRFPKLRLDPAMPVLPYALPVMAVIALFPPVWRRLMARELQRLEARHGARHGACQNPENATKG